MRKMIACLILRYRALFKLYQCEYFSKSILKVIFLWYSKLRRQYHYEDLCKSILKVIFLLFGVVSLAQAAPCYGTKMPKQNKIFMGLENYNILKRYLEDSQGKIRSTQNFLLLSFGLKDWLSLDLKGGFGNIKYHSETSVEIDYPSAFTGGYGFRLKILDSDKIKAVAGFQHISVHPQDILIGDTKQEAILDDWQLSFLISRDFGKITPYTGIKLSRTDYIQRVDGTRNRVMSDLTRDVGLAVGFDIPVNEKMWINIEGQNIDTKALALSINMSF